MSDDPLTTLQTLLRRARSAAVKREADGLTARGLPAPEELEQVAPALAALLVEAAEFAEACGLSERRAQYMGFATARDGISSPAKRAASGAARRAGTRRMSVVEQDEAAEALAAKVRGVGADADAAREVIAALRSTEAPLTKRQALAIAKAVTGRAFKTKKDALAELERWVAHAVRSGAAADGVYRSRASG